MKVILKDKLFWMNFALAMVLCNLSHGKNVYINSFKKLFSLEEVGLALYTLLTFTLTCFIVISIDFALLAPINLLFNKTSKYHNIIYKYFSALLLAPCLIFMLLKKHFDIGAEGSLISVLFTVTLYVSALKFKFWKLKSWGLIVLCTLVSIGIFTLCFVNGVMTLAILLGKFHQLKGLIF